MCPTNPGRPGSIACPIFRGALAVNPQTGDTFAWTVDLNNQDQGLWQDAVRHQRRRVRQLHHHLCQAMEHSCA